MCRHPDAVRLGWRREWGCDEPANAPVFETGCPACGGVDPACTRCNGTGIVRHYRCPSASGTTDPTVQSYMAAYYALDRFGIWPRAGGLEDQDAAFVDAVHLIDAERGAIAMAEERSRTR